ncbi:MAG: hypothetical protein JWM91_685 [Rhodospirillales bacterium]|nr:hypothetical protein [Rhodospirillales bacterium]
MANRSAIVFGGAALCFALAGCATQPTGPTVAVMPAPNKNFDAFVQDQTVCKSYASREVGGQAQYVNNQAVGGAILGTALGAGLGAAAGGGTGAAIGATSGAVLGTGLGAGYSSGSSYDLQRRYNIAYAQCMSTHGNQVPTSPAAFGPAQPYYSSGFGYGYDGYYPWGYYGPFGYGAPFIGSLSFGFGGHWGGGWHHHHW